MLAIFTALHFLVDGICAAAMAAYAVQEPALDPIVFYFALYNGIAFGTQWLTGWLLDKKVNWIRYAFLFVLVMLGAGTQSALGIKAQTLLLGIGNSVFHVAAGSLVLRRYSSYKELGIFVSSGAVGLALGLNCIVGPYPFLLACAVLSAVATYLLQQTDAGSLVQSYAAGKDASGFSLHWPKVVCLVLLLGCIVLRGFGGGNAASPYIMLFPCVFAAGKALGGIVCDRAGYRKTILFIFLLSFAALQLSGLLAAVLLVLAFNMTMPLTLRLVHWCNSRYPGMMFGLAAGCLLPGVFFKGFTIPLQAMAVLQFLSLAAAGWLLRNKTIQ
ncbi:MAG: hypothetical protein IKZ43_07810 [Acidaminococcaceae bacterium]|nr:hypothetical protein [Acidaminococcaceae bacterium]